MDFELNEEQRQIRDEVARLCGRFDDAYWRIRDEEDAHYVFAMSL